MSKIHNDILCDPVDRNASPPSTNDSHSQRSSVSSSLTPPTTCSPLAPPGLPLPTTSSKPSESSPSPTTAERVPRFQRTMTAPEIHSRASSQPPSIAARMEQNTAFESGLGLNWGPGTPPTSTSGLWNGGGGGGGPGTVSRSASFSFAERPQLHSRTDSSRHLGLPTMHEELFAASSAPGRGAQFPTTFADEGEEDETAGLEAYPRPPIGSRSRSQSIAATFRPQPPPGTSPFWTPDPNNPNRAGVGVNANPTSRLLSRYEGMLSPSRLADLNLLPTPGGIAYSNMSPFLRDGGRALFDEPAGWNGAKEGGEAEGDEYVWGTPSRRAFAYGQQEDDSAPGSRRHSLSVVPPRSAAVGSGGFALAAVGDSHLHQPAQPQRRPSYAGGRRNLFGGGNSAIHDDDLASTLANSLSFSPPQQHAELSHPSSVPIYAHDPPYRRAAPVGSSPRPADPFAAFAGSRAASYGGEYDAPSPGPSPAHGPIGLPQGSPGDRTIERRGSRFDFSSGANGSPGGGVYGTSSSPFAPSPSDRGLHSRLPSIPLPSPPVVGLGLEQQSSQQQQRAFGRTPSVSAGTPMPPSPSAGSFNFAAPGARPFPAPPPPQAPTQPRAFGPSSPPSAPAALAPNLAELGRGVPLSSVPASCPLYIVEFKAGRTDLFYAADPSVPLQTGDLVIVEADRGKDLGKIINDSITLGEVQAFQKHQAELALLATMSGGGSAGPAAPDSASPSGISPAAIRGLTKELQPKRIFSKATAAETQLLLSKQQDEAKALQLCITKVRQKKLPMEVIDAEYQWDRRKITFYFIAEQRIDFRELVRELFRQLKTRIWMGNVGSQQVM